MTQGNISAVVIADSVNAAGNRITTFELEYPRFIHSEIMTHRTMSRNAASSRAIPITATIKQVLFEPAMPIHWGKNQRGMQAAHELGTVRKALARGLWRTAGVMAAGMAGLMNVIGLHKQVANRIMEPWVRIKVVMTATEWDNFFTLRCHHDAQPEMYALASAMRHAMWKSTPRFLAEGEWHMPYIKNEVIPVDQALRISASCCAQVSYRKLDDSLEKADAIYNRLITMTPVHASPCEHQACAAPGKTSRNFVGWTQNRELLGI